MAWFACVQLIMLVALIVGIPLLVPFCLCKAWTDDTKHWRWKLLDSIYGNPEDGVVGPSWYLPSSSPRVRAYRWSALRNSCDALKYRFANPGGPMYYKTITLLGRQLLFRCGWHNEGGTNVPILSLGSP